MSTRKYNKTPAVRRFGFHLNPAHVRQSTSRGSAN